MRKVTSNFFNGQIFSMTWRLYSNWTYARARPPPGDVLSPKGVYIYRYFFRGGGGENFHCKTWVEGQSLGSLDLVCFRNFTLYPKTFSACDGPKSFEKLRGWGGRHQERKTLGEGLQKFPACDGLWLEGKLLVDTNPNLGA